MITTKLFPTQCVCVDGRIVHHQVFIILLDGQQIGNGINVDMLDGRKFIRIFDYDVPLKADLLAYFGGRADINELTFSRPFFG
jgi:hypothetical protein